MSTKRGSSTITIVNPISIIADSVELMKERVRELFISIGGFSRQERVSMNNFFKTPSLSRLNFNFFNDFNKKKALRILAPLVIIIFIILGIYFTFNRQPSVVARVNTNIETGSADKTVALNREFKFPLKDRKGKKVGEFSYIIESAELRRQIIVKGKRATAVSGRTFLIINLKLVNTLNSGLEINTRDYIRISVDPANKEWFAPDIHNDPVESQAISTKNTRVGLAIDLDVSNVKLQVGEIDSKKEIIPVSF